MRAGIPTVVFPVSADQPFWAARMAALGVGPPTYFPARELTAAVLAAQLRAVMTPAVMTAARALGERLRQENGVAAAAAVITRLTAFMAGVLKRAPALRWQADNSTGVCRACAVQFGLLTRRHHCRVCGGVFCGTCLTPFPFPNYAVADLPRVCPGCCKAVRAAVPDARAEMEQACGASAAVAAAAVAAPVSMPVPAEAVVTAAAAAAEAAPPF
jgi:branched-subunit amino acid transport protein